MAETFRVHGFHGTSRHRLDDILKHGFLMSANEYDWLGDGIYFFQDAPTRARQWATEHFGGDGAIVSAEIELVNCIDLLDVAWAQFLADVHDKYVFKLKAENIPLPRQSTGAHRLDRAVLNYAVETLESNGDTVSSIRAAFAEGSPIYPNSALMVLAHVQIAVRDTSCIANVQHYSEFPENTDD